MANHRIIITVTIICYTDYPTAVSGSIYPKSLLAELNETKIINCKFNGPVEWTFNGGSLPQNTKNCDSLEDHRLVIMNIDIYNYGAYACEGLTATKVSFKKIAWLLVKCKSQKVKDLFNAIIKIVNTMF